MNSYDLHAHTNYSDGILTPEQLIDRALTRNVKALAICDHDSTGALKAARDYIEQNRLAIQLIDGVEISAQTEYGEIHVVGLGIDMNNAKLNSMLAHQNQQRWERARAYEKKLKNLGIEGVLDWCESSCKQVVTRTHIARALVDLAHCSDMNQAFKKYIGKKGRVKVKTEWTPIDQVIQLIQGAGGKAVIAHPTRYPLSNRRLGFLIEEFAALGGDGIEISYPSLSPDKREWLELHRTKHQLAASGGSDFHYPDLKWTDLGKFPRINRETPHVISGLSEIKHWQ